MLSDRDAPKVAVALMACINSLLSEYGLNLLSHVCHLHTAVHPFLRVNWGAIRYDKLKVSEELSSYIWSLSSTTVAMRKG